MTIVLNRPRTTGRHRLGHPGLIPVSALVVVVRRGLFRSLLRRGRHSAHESRIVWQRPARVVAPAVG